MMENFLGIFLQKNKANVEPVVKIQSKVISVPNVALLLEFFGCFCQLILSVIMYIEKGEDFPFLFLFQMVRNEG